MLPKSPLLLLTALSLFSTLVASQKCSGQSCAIAALSGSTEETYEQITSGGKPPQGSNSKGKECITKYYKELGLKAPGGNLADTPPKSRYAEYEAAVARRSVRERVVESLRETGDWDVVEVGEEGVKDKEKRADCKANGLFFARGTTEMGLMGNSVGPALSRALGSKWKVDGVSYTADIAGDDCIGFPGGIKCRDQLEKMATACPQTNWFVSGYSQGAMVARICTAFSKEAVKSKIKGVVVFGDPFNGASIKGFPSDGIKTFCSASDGVCKGEFKIGIGHLSYTSGSTISEAAKWMNARAGA